MPRRGTGWAMCRKDKVSSMRQQPVMSKRFVYSPDWPKLIGI